MQKIALFTVAMLVASGSAFAGHPHVADAARLSTGNQSDNASVGWTNLSTNASDGKAAAAADKR